MVFRTLQVRDAFRRLGPNAHKHLRARSVPRDCTTTVFKSRNFPVSDHLIRKGSVYYFRRRVPADLVQAYGKSEHVRSLRTTDKREAERLVRRYDVEMDGLFETLRSA